MRIQLDDGRECALLKRETERASALRLLDSDIEHAVVCPIPERTSCSRKALDRFHHGGYGIVRTPATASRFERREVRAVNLPAVDVEERWRERLDQRRKVRA